MNIDHVQMMFFDSRLEMVIQSKLRMKTVAEIRSIYMDITQSGQLTEVRRYPIENVEWKS